jgi:hypothetical protein
MNNFSRGLLSFAAAAIAPVFVIVAFYTFQTLLNETPSDSYTWLRVRNFAILAALFSTAHVAVLGIPAFCLLHFLKRIKWWSTVLTGFVLGSVPTGVLSWPTPGSSASHWDGTKTVDTVVNGVPTIARWVSWLESVAAMGLFGAAGGLAFWLVWRNGMRPNNSFKPKPLRGSA